MTEGRTTTRRRARRSTESTARLERMRQRNADQLEAQREAERRIETALQAYVDAEVSISALERDRDDKVAALEQLIEQACAAAQVEIDQVRTQQAMAVWHIRDAGRTVQQIAELVELPQTEVRRLVRIVSPAVNSDNIAVTDPRDSTASTERPQQPSEQGELSGIDRHQDGTDAPLVPPIADSGGQCP